MELKSQQMSLSLQERHWRPWFGKTGKLAMRWSCYLNRDRYQAMEQAFENFAHHRVELLQQWTSHQWQILAGIGETFTEDLSKSQSILTEKKRLLPDCNELAMYDANGQFLLSTQSRFDNPTLNSQILKQTDKGPFLHGPYIDPLTETFGATSSSFHDAVTLMFYLAISKNNQIIGYIAARYPNDVVSDLIQREAGHIFHESGDNYLFMVKSNFNPTIPAGMALSVLALKIAPLLKVRTSKMV